MQASASSGPFLLSVTTHLPLSPQPYYRFSLLGVEFWAVENSASNNSKMIIRRRTIKEIHLLYKTTQGGQTNGINKKR